MSRITYFPRYSTKENVVTNTTLHLFSQIYRHSTERLRDLLSYILGEQDLAFGVDIHQQVRSGSSVPDGVISQEPLRIILETKVDASLNVAQLLAHCDRFDPGRRGNYLLLLSRDEQSRGQLEPVYEKAKLRGFTFKHLTFEALRDELVDSVEPYEIHLKAVVDDFVQYCADMGLLPDRRSLMRIVPCGSTANLNAKWDVYYHPADRGYTQHEYVGIYKDKAVRYIGKISSIVDYVANPSGENIIVAGQYDADCAKRVAGIIQDTKTVLGWDIASDHRFFCVEKFYPTDFRKNTPGGIQGARFYDLSGVIREDVSVQELANELRQKTWP